MKKVLACLGLIGVTCVIVFICILTQVFRFWIQNADPDINQVSITIESGHSLKEISQILEDQDLIANAFWFKFYTYLSGESKSLQASQYLLSPGLSYSDIVNSLKYGFSEDLSITIPEGYTIAQIGDLVVSNFEISESDWNYWTSISSPLEAHQFVMSSKKPRDVDLEGYLFPDTYRFFPDATAEDIVTELVDLMQAKSDQISGSGTLDSWHEVLTLASIIEREVQSEEEMKIVADIFLKRLQSNIPLQACSTVNYITGNNSPGVSESDTKIDSPYNTYMYAGLPPGPISNPGLASIEAVLNPTANDYYYFLTTEEGMTIYSKTFEEHVQNKYRYLY